MQPIQLPLNLKLRDDAIFDNFFMGSNSQIIHTLKAFVSRCSEHFIYCYGEQGVGRTHLLQACCHALSENDESIFYLPLSNAADFPPSIFESLEYQSFVCIDDVDTIIGIQEWEEALFHFYNRAREKNSFLLMSAKQPPQQLKFLLPDLQSRLTSSLILNIKNLNDDEKREALQLRTTLRGLRLSAEVANYLIHHYSRNMRDLFFILEKLDQASLVTKRKLTIPFVKFIMDSHPILR